MDKGTMQAAQSWLDKLKLKFESLARQFDLSWSKMTELGIAAAVGFFAGFAVKKYARQVVLYGIFFALGIAVLYHFEVITVNWNIVQDSVGSTPKETFEGLMTEYLQWVKEHILLAGSAAVGFLVGYKVG